MNKTIIININGIVFHIEEDAYEILRQYMTEVKRHFAYTAGSEEIVSDIENRIAEMFVERLEQEKKQVIVIPDVEFVTAQMGSVKDFDLEGEDAVFITNDAVKSEKKLFRDLDDRVIGGVCSGIGHYFNIDPKWIRLITIVVIFMGGAGLFIYAILWVVTPVALTRTDKMSMKGEEANLQNFKKNFDEELEALNHNLKKAGEHAGPALSSLEIAFRDFFSGLASFINAILKGFIKLIGAVIIFASVVAFIALVLALFGALGWNSEFHQFPFNAINDSYKGMVFLSAFIIAIIPILALLFFAIRVVFNRTMVTKTGSFVMLVIWIFGLSMGAYYGTKIGSEFKNEASFSETVAIKPMQVYYLKLNDKKFLTSEDSISYSLSSGDLKRKITINDSNDDYDNLKNNRMTISIEKSDISKPELIQTFSSQGPDFETALKTAQKINYHFEQADSVLKFDRRVRLSKEDMWRDQSVHLTLRIPQNTRLVIDESMYWRLRDFYVFNCNRHLIMTASGLKCDSLAKK